VAKSLYLSDDQLVYQLITNTRDLHKSENLDPLYSAIGSLRERRDVALKQYLVVFLAGVLARVGALQDFSAGGVSLQKAAISHVVLILFAFASFNLNLSFVKLRYSCGIFSRIFIASSPSNKAYLLARYPEAFDELRYYVTQIGFLPYTTREGWPVRMVLALILIIFGMILYVTISLWIFLGLAGEVWSYKTIVPMIWSRLFVIAAVMITVSGFALPGDLIFKRRYLHIGFVQMMNKAHDEDRPRYLRYLRWVMRIRGEL